MQTSTIQQPHKTERLADAFRIFNELSQNLSVSYQGLEKQVSKLHAELAAARSERLKTLVEKEKIVARLQQILAALPAAVIVLDAEGRIADYNATAVNFLGEPLEGQYWREVLEGNLAAADDSPHERRLRGDRRVSISYSPCDADAGQIVLLSDVSEMRALQERVSQQKQLSAMGEMVASMAHQVRTPLSTALLYASQLSRAVLDDDKRRKFSRKILERLHYLERQVEDMLIYAKEGRLAMESFVLSDFLSNINDAIQDRIVPGTIMFKTVNQTIVQTLTGNENALRGVVLNLLNNALDACPEGGIIDLTVSQTDSGELVIQVSDSGIGMTKNICERIFEPFYTTKNSGTGLGLAVVDSVVRAHGGSVRCESQRGTGTTFTLILPIVTDEGAVLPGGFSGRKHHLMEVGHEAV